MATKDYITGRQKYQRPQGILFADNPGTIQNGFYVPDGIEIGSASHAGNFLILSDDNRGPIDFSIDRIETRQRTINGRMRSFHVADKLNLSLSWSMLPSRSHSLLPKFSIETGIPAQALSEFQEYTSDGGAGGNELLDWYENNQGSFWVYLAYDKYTNFDSDSSSGEYKHLGQYNQVIEMFISNFDYSVQKRGGTNFDMWDISMSLEEA